MKQRLLEHTHLVLANICVEVIARNQSASHMQSQVAVSTLLWNKQIFLFCQLTLQPAKEGLSSLWWTLWLWQSQRMRWIESITNSMDMNLRKFQEIVEDRGAWGAAVHRVTKNPTWLSNWTATTTNGYGSDTWLEPLPLQGTSVCLMFLHSKSLPGT